jgi:hypothetical protein
MMKTLLDKEDSVFNPPQLGCVLAFTGLPGGDGKIYDRSPYGNVGTITGATWVRLPSGLWCLSFDGSDDRVNCGNNASLALSDALTIEAWFRSDDVTNVTHIISRNLGFYLRIAGGEIYWRIASAVTGNWATTCQTSGLNLQTNTWYFGAVLYDKALGTENLKIYLGGVQVAMADNADGIKVNANDNCIGELVGAERFHGLIGLLRIHNRALAALEIQNRFNREKHLFGVW